MLKKSLFLITFGLGLSALFSACGGVIPEAYRGNYIDNAKGARLELSASHGRFEGPGGRTLSYSIEEYNADEEWQKILSGQAAVYPLIKPDRLTLYWVNPDPATRMESSDKNFVWYERVEILYFTADPHLKMPVSNLNVTYSDEGKLELDLLKKKWALGWKPKATKYSFVRE